MIRSWKLRILTTARRYRGWLPAPSWPALLGTAENGIELVPVGFTEDKNVDIADKPLAGLSFVAGGPGCVVDCRGDPALIRKMPIGSGNELGSVMLADRGRPAVAEGIEEAHRVGLDGELAEFGLVSPLEGDYLVVGGEVTAGDLTAED